MPRDGFLDEIDDLNAQIESRAEKSRGVGGENMQHDFTAMRKDLIIILLHAV